MKIKEEKNFSSKKNLFCRLKHFSESNFNYFEFDFYFQIKMQFHKNG